MPDETDGQRDLRTEQQTREKIAAERVGAQQIDAPWRVDAEQMNVRVDAEQGVRRAPDEEAHWKLGGGVFGVGERSTGRPNE